MNSSTPWDKLASYFANELPPDEKRELESWIDEDPDRALKVQELYRIWRQAEKPVREPDLNEAWETLAGKMERHEQVGSEPAHALSGRVVGHIGQKRGRHSHAVRSAGRSRRIALTVAILLIAMTAGLLTTLHPLMNESELAVEIIPDRELVTQQGERAMVVFEDGSRVYLHADSRLVVPAGYNEQDRELTLEGIAYFDVVHNPEKPFTVRAGRSYTRVLGTRFMVQAWPQSAESVEVVVSDGRVEFGEDRHGRTTNGDGVILTENQKGILHGDGGPQVSQVEDMEWYLGWTEGRLVVRDRPLKDVVRKLEQWYAVRIDFKGQAAGERRITAEIDHNQPMREVMEGIALSLELGLEIGDRTVTFTLKE